MCLNNIHSAHCCVSIATRTFHNVASHSVSLVPALVNHRRGGLHIAWVWGRLHVNVKVVLFQARKDIRGVEVYLQSFLTWALYDVVK